MSGLGEYCVNKNPQRNGDHEVHIISAISPCPNLPYPENSIYLGQFSNCRGAVEKARLFYDRVDGCMHCAPACHNR